MTNTTKHTIPGDAARAVDRFNPRGPAGYRSSHDTAAPLRSTRAEATADYTANLETGK